FGSRAVSRVAVFHEISRAPGPSQQAARPILLSAKWSKRKDIHAIAAAMGMVITQAHMMLVAMPHRTALVRCMLPTPAMAPAIACVVETGWPRYVEIRTATAAPVSAQNPLRGFRRVRRPPMVRTIRQPPLMVPNP